MDNKKVKQYGFFMALLMVFSSVVGIGIFIKNGRIFKGADGDGIAVILAWIVGGSISLTTALSFAEAFKEVPTDSNDGIGSPAEKFVSKGFGNFTKISFVYFYLALFTPVVLHYTYIFLMQALGYDPHWIGSIIASTLGVVALISLSIFKAKGVELVLGVTSLIKLLPLVLAILMGIFLQNNGGKVGDITGPIDTDGVPAYKNSESTFTAMLVVMPAIMMTYDAFANVSSIRGDVKNADKNVPLAIFFGMTGIMILYTLVTIAQLNNNAPDVGGVFTAVTNNDVMATIVSVIIVISGLGTAQSMAIAETFGAHALIESDLFYVKERKTDSEHQQGGVIAVYFSLAYTLVFGLITMIVNLTSGSVVWSSLDIISEEPTRFFFIIYGIIVAGYMIFRIKKWNDYSKKSNIYVMIVSAISVIGITFIQIYLFVDFFRGIKDMTWSDGDWLKSLAIPVGLILNFAVTFSILFRRNKKRTNQSFKNVFKETIRFRKMKN